MFQSLYLNRAEKKNGDGRLKAIAIFFLILVMVIIVKLAVLMIVEYNFYTAMAAGVHETYSHLMPKRGSVYVQDIRSHEKYPLAMNRDYFLMFADTREILDAKMAEEIFNKLNEFFHYDEVRKGEILTGLNKRSRPYVPIEKRVEEEVEEKVKALKLPGIYFVRNSVRYYPEKELAASVIGFVGKDEKGNDVGHYGIEGYWNKELAGQGGFFSGAKSASGGLIPLLDWTMKPAEDGANIVLTLDRSLQYQLCERLRQAQEEYGAESATLVMMEPQTGAIRAMCSLPDFNPNLYNQVKNAAVFNNNSVFTPYEPGSIFKLITMAAALNEGMVVPETTFVDTGGRSEFCQTPIKNAMDKVYGRQTMSEVLENSVNTGMVFVVEKLGKKKFSEYMKNFGFGVKEGIELDTEVSGNVDSLTKNKGDQIDCYAATASFGQGITATPLQMVTAYSVIANGGKLMKPYIVEEINYPDGRIEKIKPKEIRRVINDRSALLLNGMLVNVVDKGHAKQAGVRGYYIGGKTGTAQIPGPGGYIEETNHSFVGVAPVDDPKFVMLIKFEKPKRVWAEATAAPLFGELANFILKYYRVPPSR